MLNMAGKDIATGQDNDERDDNLSVLCRKRRDSDTRRDFHIPGR